MATKGYVGDGCPYAIIIEVELKDVSNGYTTNTIDDNVELVGECRL